MRHRASVYIASVWFIAAWVGCGEKHATVSFVEADKAIGRWAHSSAGTRQAAAGRSGAAGDAADPEDPDDLDTMAPPAIAGAGAGGGAQAGSLAGASGSGDASQGRVVLSYSVTTVMQHPAPATKPAADAPEADRIKYDRAHGPRNMGAIWIEDPAGKFVRSIEVWASNRERFKHLIAYTRAIGSADPMQPRKEAQELESLGVDVVVSATLQRGHKAHDAETPLTDRSAKPLPAGKYVFKVEVADYNTFDTCTPQDCGVSCDKKCEVANAMCSVPFDTSAPTGAIAIPSGACNIDKMSMSISMKHEGVR